MPDREKRPADSVICFGIYRLDLEQVQLWRGTQEVKLRGKVFAVLHYFVEHPGQLVTKDDLFEVVWPETVVSDATLASCIQDLRQVLEDKAKKPRYIETVHGRGYRFIAAVTTQPVQGSKFKVQSSKSEPTSNPQSPTPSFVGREAELAQLHGWLAKALSGERQIIFIIGEAGIGKTTLVDAFLQTLDSRRQTLDASLWIGRGQCIEHHGAGEPYLPVLEALGRLCREPEGKRIIELLTQHAPTWLVQMPALVDADELEALQRKTAGATRERMLRELAEAVEVLTAEHLLVLWFEDLHWCDHSTLDWLSFLARRRERARILVLGSYRPVEAIVNAHPLRTVKQDLQVHRQCEEFTLGLLSEADVAEYLAQRFSVEARHAVPLQQLARLIHRRTDGNPLFMVNVVDALVTRGVIASADGQGELWNDLEQAAAAIPASLRQMIEQQIERFGGEERRMLEVASVAGVEFPAAAVAVGLGTAIEDVEERCEELARREQFLRPAGMSKWPDGTVAARYGFLHALYQEVLYERLPAGRQQRLHQRIGEREEGAYGERAREIAAELAVHFEQGRDYHKAVQYLQQAGENAVRRSAHQEAISLLTKGLELLKTLPDTRERAHQELRLQITLGPVLIASNGFAAPEVGYAYARAQELCGQVGETPQLFPALFGVWLFYWGRGELPPTQALGEQLLRLVQNGQDPALLLQAHHALWPTLVYLGELTAGRAHWEQGITLYDPHHHLPLASRYGGHDPGVCCRNFSAVALWLMGYPDQALRRMNEALTLAQELAHPYSLALSLEFAARLHHLRREEQEAQERATAVIRLSREQGFALTLAWGSILQEWVLANRGQEEKSIVQIRQRLSALRTRGTEIMRPYHLALLAEVYGRGGQAEEGLSVLAEALDCVGKTGERFYEAELYRLKGQLTLQSKVSSPKSKVEEEAEECFWKAIEIARRQQAKSLELRAMMSLSRLWKRQGKQHEAHRMLSEIYNWFTEGLDTKDLQEAKGLMEELDH